MTLRRATARSSALLRAAACAALVALLGAPPPAEARRTRPAPELKPVELARLPAEARPTVELVLRGGPFPYRRDGVVFENREGRLPRRERAYYREYTVPTPGRRDRGPRRLVVGADREFYYSDDHYRSFRRVKGIP